MRLKSFQGRTLQEAMNKVKQELGENAVILATRTESGGLIQITAALDDTAPQIVPAQTADAFDLISETLHAHGTPPELVDCLIDKMMHYREDEMHLNFGAAVETSFKFNPISFDLQHQPLCLVGPPGVGKTLAIAKIATQATLKKQKVRLITTDLDRAGAAHQLQCFAQILGIDLVSVEDPASLGACLDMDVDCFTLIDSAGINPYAAEERRRLQKFLSQANIEPVLVMTAHGDPNEACDIAHIFQEIGAKRLMITRADMTRRLGSILAIANQTELALANFSSSQNPSHAPDPFNAFWLTKLFLPDLFSEQKTGTCP